MLNDTERSFQIMVRSGEIPSTGKLGAVPSAESTQALFGASKEDPHKKRAEIIKSLKAKGEPLVERLAASPLPTKFGDWSYVIYKDKTTNDNHHVLVYGDLTNGALKDHRNDMLVRLHASHKPSELFGSHTSDDREQLDESMKLIQKNGSGMVVYVTKDGRGNGEEAQIKQFGIQYKWQDKKIVEIINPDTRKPINTNEAYKMQGLPNEARDYYVEADILRDLKVEKIRLITNNPGKTKGLTEAGINVIGTRQLIVHTDNPFTKTYRESQQQNGYHLPTTIYERDKQLVAA